MAKVSGFQFAVVEVVEDVPVLWVKKWGTGYLLDDVAQLSAIDESWRAPT